MLPCLGIQGAGLGDPLTFWIRDLGEPSFVECRWGKDVLAVWPALGLAVFCSPQYLGQGKLPATDRKVTRVILALQSDVQLPDLLCDQVLHFDNPLAIPTEGECADLRCLDVVEDLYMYQNKERGRLELFNVLENSVTYVPRRLVVHQTGTEVSAFEVIDKWIYWEYDYPVDTAIPDYDLCQDDAAQEARGVTDPDLPVRPSESLGSSK